MRYIPFPKRRAIYVGKPSLKGLSYGMTGWLTHDAVFQPDDEAVGSYHVVPSVEIYLPRD